MKQFLLFSLTLFYLVACDKDPIPPVAPTLTTGNAGSIGYTTATVNWSISNIWNSIEVGILYSSNSTALASANAQKASIVDFKTGNNSVSITGLSAGKLYYYMPYATDGYAFIYGDVKTFTTSIDYATLTTNSVSNISATQATCGGTITNNGGGNITARGVCWGTSSNPTISNNKTSDGTGTGSFASSLTGLQAETTYYVRAYATNAAGIAYGNQVSFLAANGSSSVTVTDIDGNIYHTVTIGTQTWMVENLKTTRYRNGTTIPNITDGTTWTNLSTGAYCDYDSTPNNSIIYGKLYNWYAVIDSRNIAPTGWHVPTDAEWTMLTTYLGGESVAGGKLKETGTAHWIIPNLGATNESGFTALPGGRRGYYIGSVGNWWSSSEGIDIGVWIRSVDYNSSELYRYGLAKNSGLSVRCIKDY